MLKFIAGLSMLLALGSLSTQTFAGPSHRVRCTDPGRKTELLFHDAKPNQAFFEIEGRHNQLPKSSSSFVVNTAGVASPKVTNYKPYEVELTLENPAQIVTRGDDSKEIGILEKVILENHAELKIDVSDRPAAAILVLSSGLQLRFNGCRIDGGTAVMDWAGTFGTDSSD